METERYACLSATPAALVLRCPFPLGSEYPLGHPADARDARLRLLADDRKLPVGEEPVEGTTYDFRVTRPLRATVLDDAFGELARDAQGVGTAEVRDPATGRRIDLSPQRRRRSHLRGRPDPRTRRSSTVFFLSMYQPSIQILL